MANLCEATGADAATVGRAIGYDERIGPRAMVPGLGYGDIRDSPALEVANQLHEAGAHVSVYDPMATENARAA